MRYSLDLDLKIRSGQVCVSRDEWIPLFSDIRILGYLGYWFFLDTWIIGYLDIMHTWIHGYLDTWISIFFGYMDTWILWISNFFIIQILDILSKYPDIFGYFFLSYHTWKKGNQIQVWRLCSVFILSIDFLAFESGVLMGDLSDFIISLCISCKLLD